jgi:hypothetical protein
MNQHQRYERRERSTERPYQRRQDNNQDSALDQHASGIARQLIKEAGVDDTTQIWRALKRAYLAGYADANRS